MQQWQNKFISSYTIGVYNSFGWTGNKLPWFVIYCSYKMEYLKCVIYVHQIYEFVYRDGTWGTCGIEMKPCLYGKLQHPNDVVHLVSSIT